MHSRQFFVFRFLSQRKQKFFLTETKKKFTGYRDLPYVLSEQSDLSSQYANMCVVRWLGSLYSRAELIRSTDHCYLLKATRSGPHLSIRHWLIFCF
jgi:hypothetical protein